MVCSSVRIGPIYAILREDLTARARERESPTSAYAYSVKSTVCKVSLYDSSVYGLRRDYTQVVLRTRTSKVREAYA